VLSLCVWVLVMALATRDVGHRGVRVVALRGILRGVGLAHGVAVTFELLLFSELSAVTVYDEAAVCNKAVRSEWITQKAHKSDIQRLSRREIQSETMNPIRLWLKPAEQVFWRSCLVWRAVEARGSAEFWSSSSRLVHSLIIVSRRESL